jgi:hypothetical protein
MIKVAVIVKQADIVLDGNRSNHTVNRLPDRDAPLSKGSVDPRCSHECCPPHGQEDKIVKILLRFDILCVGSDALKHFRQDNPAETQILLVLLSTPEGQPLVAPYGRQKSRSRLSCQQAPSVTRLSPFGKIPFPFDHLQSYIHIIVDDVVYCKRRYAKSQRIAALRYAPRRLHRRDSWAVFLFRDQQLFESLEYAFDNPITQGTTSA